MRAFPVAKFKNVPNAAPRPDLSLGYSLIRRYSHADRHPMHQTLSDVEGKTDQYALVRSRGMIAILDPKDDLDTLSRFTPGRWLWREQEQLACRYVKFGLQELLDIAASAVGAPSCIRARKTSEGQYNKVLFLTMDNGRELLRQYQPIAAKKLSTLHNYPKVAPYTLPENSATHASVLWHGNLNLQNIFVDPKEPTNPDSGDH